MKNKKADILSPEVMWMLIAVICISLLFYLGVKLYGILTVSQQIDHARARLNGIIGKISELGKDGDFVLYLVNSPDNWYLVYFNDLKQLPKNCNGERCLCMCFGSPTLEACEKDDVCKNIESLKIVGKCSFGEPSNKKITENCKYLEKLPFNLIIRKNKGIIEIIEEKDLEDVDLTRVLFYQLLNYQKEIGDLTVMQLIQTFIENKENKVKALLEERVGRFLEEKSIYMQFQIYDSDNNLIFWKDVYSSSSPGLSNNPQNLIIKNLKNEEFKVFFNAKRRV